MDHCIPWFLTMKYTLESTFFSSSDRHSSHTLHIYAFQKVSNVEQIKQAIPDLDCAILNGDLVIFPPKQVFYAAIKALYVCKTKDIKRIIKSDKTDSEKKEFSNTYCMEEEVAAISRRRGEEMRTRSLYTELIYRLSPSTNVTDSLRQFGISQTAETILFAKIDEQESDKVNE